MFPQKMFEVKRPEMLFNRLLSWRYFLKKSILEKVKTARTLRDYKDFFQFFFPAALA